MTTNPYQSYHLFLRGRAHQVRPPQQVREPDVSAKAEWLPPRWLPGFILAVMAAAVVAGIVLTAGALDQRHTAAEGALLARQVLQACELSPSRVDLSRFGACEQAQRVSEGADTRSVAGG